MTISRRSLIASLICLVAAPAIVRAGSLMPVKSFDPETLEFVPMHPGLYSDPVAVTRKAFIPRLFVQLRYAGPDVPLLYSGFEWLGEHSDG